MIALILAVLCLALGYGATAAFGAAMVPPPPEIFGRLLALALGGEIATEGLRTFGRGLAGVGVANLAGIVLGVAAGAWPLAARVARPLLAALNACPPVVWIALAMVWIGSGGGTPVFAVAAATLPPLFLAVLEGVRAVDPRLAAMSRLYGVPTTMRLRRLVVPTALPFWRAAFAHTTAAAWKVAAVAEFLGSGDGVGARIYWAYRRLEMADLYAWALMVMALGVAVDAGLARVGGGRAAR